MSVITDKIKTADYIYSAITKWGLKRYVCDVEYYVDEPLDDLFFVICSILDSTSTGCYDKRDLGILLGFSMVDQINGSQHEVYFDIAEVRVFEDILARIEQEHLIKVSDHEIFLTELGRISLKEGKHYRFFAGQQNVYEHSGLKSSKPTAMLMFPFYKDMGISTELHEKKQIWPDDDIIKEIIYSKTDPLKKRLEYHSKEPAHIYKAVLQDYFDLEVIKIPVKLYQYEGEYIPAIMNGGKLAERATDLICEEVNAVRKENIILECLFKQLWDDKTTVLDFKALEPYLDLVDYEELTKDSRTVWTDRELFNTIVDKANSTCWRNITRYCDIDVLRNHIEDYKELLDWSILSERIDDDFLIANFITYPWDLEIISEDYERKVTVIEQLILLQKETEEEWNWEELENRLSEDFVLAHLDVVKVDLSAYTNDTESAHKAILDNIDKRWDWNKIESEFNLQYIYENISALSNHFRFISLFDRVFTDAYWADKFARNSAFKSVISAASKKNGVLSSAIFNNKDYIWTDSVIDLLSKNELLCWPSTPYMIGFECNPHLEWSKDFFNKYSSNISTSVGKKYVSSQIRDVDILAGAPNFDWDWDAISSNTTLLSNSRLYVLYGTRLNWSTVLEYQQDASFLQSIIGIKSMIADNADAWSAFSAIANVDYVIEQYKKNSFPWDWTVLTERMFKKLKLENLGNEQFVDKWDWKYLSEHVNTDFLTDNLEKFSKYWDWDIALPRILSKERRFDFTFLDPLANTLTNISGNERCKNAWTALTSQYSFKELKKIILETTRKRAYWWDMDYFCRHKDFNVFLDLEDCRNVVDWTILSSSESVDRSLKYTPQLGIKEKAWKEQVRKLLSDQRNKWNFTLLSHFESLNGEQWFITLFRDKIDWDYISQNSKLFCTKDKQELNALVESYKKYINFTLLSQRSDVDIAQIIRIIPQAGFDYNKLVETGSIKVSLKLVEEKPDYAWDWQMVSSKKEFVPSAGFLLSHITCDLNWDFLSSQDNQLAWRDDKLIAAIATNKSVSEQINWYKVSSFDYFPISEEILSEAPVELLNWKHLSASREITPFIDKYSEFIDWSVLSQNEKIISLDIDILDKYKDHLDWGIICRKQGFVFTNDILERFSQYIDWNLASDSKDIKFSKALVEKFKDKWDWPVLVRNKAFNNTVDMTDSLFVKKVNIVDFINKFPQKPRAFHFTHMDNAVKIIRAMKLQSRNYAEGNFSNSAGTNVNRTAKAHNFARFYFMPKSPTQFYNECLGKDTDDHKYYHKARQLGLPKCPLTVFFIFDVEELLTVMPDLCYYSNGNMQKDSSKCFKVVENPNRIKAHEIYINERYTFEERQQEFLVEGELDFSKLNNVQICCYDSYQAELLKRELKGTKWEDVVSVGGDKLYERKNKKLIFNETSDSIEISTNYKCPYELRVSYSGTAAPSIVNKSNVIRQRGNNIYVSSFVDIKRDTPFEVYFEVSDPRVGSWLIYRNK